MSMSGEWEGVVQDAVLETDYRRLGDRIDSALAVLCARLLELGSRPEHLGERHRIVDALQTLHLIRRIELEVRVEDRVGRTIN